MEVHRNRYVNPMLLPEGHPFCLGFITVQGHFGVHVMLHQEFEDKIYQHERSDCHRQMED